MFRQCNYADVIFLNLIFIIAQVRDIKVPKALLKLKKNALRLKLYLGSRCICTNFDRFVKHVYELVCRGIALTRPYSIFSCEPCCKYILQRRLLNYGKWMR